MIQVEQVSVLYVIVGPRTLRGLALRTVSNVIWIYYIRVCWMCGKHYTLIDRNT